MSKNTVQKYVCALVDRGLISTEDTEVVTKNGLKRNGNLRYTIQPIKKVMEDFYRRQLEWQKYSTPGHRKEFPA